jgi:hypothetical protein
VGPDGRESLRLVLQGVTPGGQTDVLRRVVPLNRTVRPLDGGQATLISIELWTDSLLLRLVEPDDGAHELGEARWYLVDRHGHRHAERRRDLRERFGQRVVEIELPPAPDEPFISLLVQRGVNGQPSVFGVILGDGTVGVSVGD